MGKNDRWVPLLQDQRNGKVEIPGYPRVTTTYPSEEAAWKAARKAGERDKWTETVEEPGLSMQGRMARARRKIEIDHYPTMGVAKIPKGAKLKDIVGVL
jgi:hypothetical protein